MDEETQKLQGLEKELSSLEQKPTVPASIPAIPVTPAPTPEVPPIPPDLNKNKSKKVLWLSIGFFVLSLIIAGVYFLRQGGLFEQKPTATPTSTSSPTPEPTATPDPTANWKTYTNTTLGFLVKYPLNWEIKNSTPQPSADVVDIVSLRTTIPSDSPQQGDVTTGWAEIMISASEKSVDELISDLQAGLIEKTSMMISGKTATRITQQEGVAGSVYVNNIVVTHNDSTFRIALTTQDAENKVRFETEFNQILSTFQFTE